jgi:hypothetical protein
MTEAWTPGPWRWEGDVTPGEDKYRDEALDTRKNYSSGVTLEGPERSVAIPWDYEGYSSGVHIRPEDARLICLAPEMAELLEKSRALCDGLLMTYPEQVPLLDDTVGELRNDIRVLLARARGEDAEDRSPR